MPRRELNGWMFDIAAERDGMTVWFRTVNGETVALFAPFRPSFVLAGERLKEPALRAAAARWKCALSRGEGVDFFSGRTVPAWTFAVASPALLGPSVRKAESAFGPEALCNADIAPEQQFSCATGLYPLSRAVVDCDGDGTIRAPGAPARPSARVHPRRRDARSPLGERGGLPAGPPAAGRPGRPRPARHRIRRRLAAAAAPRAGRPAPRAPFRSSACLRKGAGEKERPAGGTSGAPGSGRTSPTAG